MATWKCGRASDVWEILYPKLNSRGITLAMVERDSERYKYILNIYNGGVFGTGMGRFVKLDPKRCKRVLEQYWNNVQFLGPQDNRYIYLCSGKKFRDTSKS